LFDLGRLGQTYSRRLIKRIRVAVDAFQGGGSTMSATAARLRDPEDLFALPPEIDDDQVRHLIREHLTDEGRVAFVSELVAALRRAKNEGDLTYINEVVEAWTRTAMIVDKSFHKKWKRAQADAKDPNAPVLTLDQIRAKLKLDA